MHNSNNLYDNLFTNSNTKIICMTTYLVCTSPVQPPTSTGWPRISYILQCLDTWHSMAHRSWLACKPGMQSHPQNTEDDNSTHWGLSSSFLSPWSSPFLSPGSSLSALLSISSWWSSSVLAFFFLLSRFSSVRSTVPAAGCPGV